MLDGWKNSIKMLPGMYLDKEHVVHIGPFCFILFYFDFYNGTF